MHAEEWCKAQGATNRGLSGVPSVNAQCYDLACVGILCPQQPAPATGAYIDLLLPPNWDAEYYKKTLCSSTYLVVGSKMKIIYFLLVFLVEVKT